MKNEIAIVNLSICHYAPIHLKKAWTNRGHLKIFDPFLSHVFSFSLQNQNMATKNRNRDILYREIQFADGRCEEEKKFFKCPSSCFSCTNFAYW
jgi:hypothetical protein